MNPTAVQEQWTQLWSNISLEETDGPGTPRRPLLRTPWALAHLEKPSGAAGTGSQCGAT